MPRTAVHRAPAAEQSKAETSAPMSSAFERGLNAVKQTNLVANLFLLTADSRAN